MFGAVGKLGESLFTMTKANKPMKAMKAAKKTAAAKPAMKQAMYSVCFSVPFVRDARASRKRCAQRKKERKKERRKRDKHYQFNISEKSCSAFNCLLCFCFSFCAQSARVAQREHHQKETKKHK